jgi:hypothetical protein
MIKQQDNDLFCESIHSSIVDFIYNDLFCESIHSSIVDFIYKHSSADTYQGIHEVGGDCLYVGTWIGKKWTHI